MTVELFLGGLGSDPNKTFFGSHPTKEQELLNREFVQHTTGYKIPTRNKDFGDLSDDEVNDGDHIAIFRLDGLDQIIALGTGSRSSHTTLIFKDDDGVAWVYESQDAWYWPLKHGFQKNKFSDWKVAAKNAGFNAIVLPLKEEKRKILQKNKQKIMDWFKKYEGTPYGYANFLMGYLDTPN